MSTPEDEFANMGGSYTLDPKTGKRIRVEYTSEREEAAQDDLPACTAPDQSISSNEE